MSAKVDGLKPLLVTLDRVKKGAKNKVLRRAVRKSSSIVLKAAKVKCPQRIDASGYRKENKSRGLLRKSLGIKIATYPKAVVGIIGPRRGFKTQIGVIRSGPNAGKPIFEDPANIAHLVEFGTRPHSLAKGDKLLTTVSGKAKKGEQQTAGAIMHPGSKPNSFMRDAWDNNRSQIRSTMSNEIAGGIATLAKGGNLSGE